MNGRLYIRTLIILYIIPSIIFGQSKPTDVNASFTGPDTTCKNTPIHFTNTSVGASNYYWSFCAAGFNTTPAADNLGDPGNHLKTPVFMDYALDDNGNYYGFISNYENGHIVRLNYGSSLLNTPTTTDLGNFSLIPIYAEGIQVKKANGKCYVFVVAAGNDQGTNSVLVRLDFGNSFSNSPTAISLGNKGQMQFPHDLFITQENNNYYGFTINIINSTITRFDFGNDLANTPSGVNLGSIGNFNYPCGFSFVNTNGNWYAFITNRDNNSISRLNFGASLTNVPTGNNIGNPGGFLNRPRDISIFQSCEGIVGLVVNEEDEETGTITKLDFGDDLLSNPQATDLGNQGNVKFPHSISKFFLEGNDIYCFITNVKNNTITRLRYIGCTSTNIPSSTLQTPPPVIYSEPGIYNINLLVDIGLPTQTSFCKQMVVINCDSVCNLKAEFKYQQTTCNPKIVQFKNVTIDADSIWWDFGNGKTDTSQNPLVNYLDYGQYVVHLYAKTDVGCFDTATDSIMAYIKKDSAVITKDTSICAGSSVQLNAINSLNYCWSPAKTLSDSSIQNPVASPAVTTKYYLNILTANGNPVIQDSITVTVVQPPLVNAGKDIPLCKKSSVQLNASGAYTYNWNASPYLSDTTIANPVATPLDTTKFIVTGYNIKGCFNRDTVQVDVLALPPIILTNDTAICKDGSIMLQAIAKGNNKFKWVPATGLSDPDIFNPLASPAVSTKYFVNVTDSNNCEAVDSVKVDVLNIPVVSTINDTGICKENNIALKTNAAYATIFKWTPDSALSNANIQSPYAFPLTSTVYTVTAGNGVCSTKDSVLITILSLPAVKAVNDTTVCGNASAQLYALGAISYVWKPVKGLSDPNIPDPVASPGSTTKYFVTGTAGNSCTNTDSVAVIVDPAPAFNISPKNIALCKGDSVTLIASGGDKYLWSPSVSVTDPLAPVIKVFPSTSTIYQVAVTNTACRFTDSLQSKVTVLDLPVATITKSNDIDCLNFEAQLVATGGVSYQWYPLTYISNSHIANPVVNPPVDTKYSVVVKNENSCKATDAVIVQSNTLDANTAKFEIAGAFTPNHDGLNDCFSVKYWGPANFFDISIYDRWGYLVYHSNNINNCWDGAVNGRPQAPGTYVYKITVSSNCSNGLVHKKGTLVLIR